VSKLSHVHISAHSGQKKSPKAASNLVYTPRLLTDTC
jgi:hypothetical protein